MTRFEVAMTGSLTGSTQAQIIEVEDLLRDFHATYANDNSAPVVRRRFDGRPVIAACLVFFVFAPGCAAAAVFLLRNDGTVPPFVQPDRMALVTKSDRLPRDQWTNEATEHLAPKEEARIVAAAVLEDRKFLEPMLIRGSLDEGTITAFAEATGSDLAAIASTATAEPAPAPMKSRTKRQARRMPPVRVAEVVPPPAPPQPTFFEKLFGARFN